MLSDPTLTDPTKPTASNPTPTPTPTPTGVSVESPTPTPTATDTSGSAPASAPQLPPPPPPSALPAAPAAQPPSTTTPYTATSGQTFVGGTQTTDPTTGQVTNNGILGQQYVPGSNNGLIDLGGGMVAPAPGTDPSKGYMTVLPPTLPADYSPNGLHIGDVTAAGKITGWNELGGPIYDKSVTNPAVPDPFAHTFDGLQAGDLAAQGFSSDPFNTPGHMIAGATPTQQEMQALFASRLSGAGPASTGANSAQLAAANAAGGTRSLSPGAASDAGTPSALPSGSYLAASLGSGVPGVGLSTINPGDDLRNKLISPDASGRLSGLQGMVDDSAKSLANVDRVKLAGDMFDTLAARTAPQYERDLRTATQRAAANGTLGSGMLNTSYGDLAHNRALELDTARQGLLQNALSDSVNDAFNKERALSGLESQLYGQEAGNRNEMRGERGYQVGQEQSAFDRALQQYLTGQGVQNTQFNQGLSLLQLAMQGNPASTQAAMAGQSGMDPATIQLLAQMLGRNSVPSIGGGPVPGVSGGSPVYSGGYPSNQANG